MQNIDPPRRPFQWNRHTAILAGLILLALALPVGLIVYGITRNSSSNVGNSGEPAAPSELRNSLEAMAEKSLPAPDLQPGSLLEARVPAADPAALRETLTALVERLGGTTLPSSGEDEGRLLISLPAGTAGDGLRQLELATGTALPAPGDPADSLLLELRVEPAR